jgi:glycosyltransferase involved in cell wall biosynthesis
VQMSAGPLVCFLIPDLGLAGAEIVSTTLAREFLRRGYRIDIVTIFEISETQQSLPEGARHFPIPSKNIRELFFPYRRYLRERRPDVIVASLWPLTVIAVLAKVTSLVKACLILWDHNTLSIQYGGRGLARRLFLEASLRFFYPLADARVAVSNGVADDLAHLSALPRDKFEVIYNPIYLAPVAELGQEREAESLWGGWGGPRIITVGRFKPQKNHAMLLEAFKKLLVVRDARLLILGTGVLYESTAALARSLGVADKVLLPGSRVNPAAYYKSADLFVLSSDFEGFGNVIVEALACGLPVVSTDCRSGPSEILERGLYGRLVPVGDAAALAQAMLDSLDATHDKEALQQRALDFSPERVADQFLRLLLPQASDNVTL